MSFIMYFHHQQVHWSYFVVISKNQITESLQNTPAPPEVFCQVSAAILFHLTQYRQFYCLNFIKKTQKQYQGLRFFKIIIIK